MERRRAWQMNSIRDLVTSSISRFMFHAAFMDSDEHGGCGWFTLVNIVDVFRKVVIF